jgi:hypothetical protein
MRPQSTRCSRQSVGNSANRKHNRTLVAQILPWLPRTGAVLCGEPEEKADEGTPAAARRRPGRLPEPHACRIIPFIRRARRMLCGSRAAVCTADCHCPPQCPELQPFSDTPARRISGPTWRRSTSQWRVSGSQPPPARWGMCASTCERPPPPGGRTRRNRACRSDGQGGGGGRRLRPPRRGRQAGSGPAAWRCWGPEAGNSDRTVARPVGTLAKASCGRAVDEANRKPGPVLDAGLGLTFRSPRVTALV